MYRHTHTHTFMGIRKFEFWIFPANCGFRWIT